MLYEKKEVHNGPAGMGENTERHAQLIVLVFGANNIVRAALVHIPVLFGASQYKLFDCLLYRTEHVVQKMGE